MGQGGVGSRKALANQRGVGGQWKILEIPGVDHTQEGGREGEAAYSLSLSQFCLGQFAIIKTLSITSKKETQIRQWLYQGGSWLPFSVKIHAGRAVSFAKLSGPRLVPPHCPATCIL